MATKKLTHDLFGSFLAFAIATRIMKECRSSFIVPMVA